MTIKPWTERFPDPAPVGVMRQLATLRLMQDEIDDLRKESAWLKKRIRNLLNELWSETNCEYSEDQACRFAQERDDARAELESLRDDAEKWRAYKARKDAVIAAGMGRNPLRSDAPGAKP